MASIDKVTNNNIAGQNSPIEFSDDEGNRYQIVPTGDTFHATKNGTIHGGFKRPVTAKTAAYTVKESECGTLFTTRGASGAVTFTLPAASGNSGLWFEFFNVADQNMTVATADEELVAMNDLTADSIAFSTSSEKIGGGVRVVCDGTSWFAMPILGTEAQSPTIASS